MSTLHAEAYLILEANKTITGVAKSMKVVKVTQGYPLLNDSQVAVKVHVNINGVVFEQGMANIVIDVPDLNQVVHAEVIEP